METNEETKRNNRLVVLLLLGLAISSVLAWFTTQVPPGSVQP